MLMSSFFFQKEMVFHHMNLDDSLEQVWEETNSPRACVPYHRSLGWFVPVAVGGENVLISNASDLQKTCFRIEWLPTITLSRGNCSSWKNSRRWIEVRGDLSVCDQEPRHYGQAQAVRRVPQVHFCCTISHARWLLLMLNVVHYSMNLSRLTSRMFDCQALDH